MNKMKWFLAIFVFLLLREIVLLGVYTAGYFALPWSVGFSAVWFVICGLFFWYFFDGKARRGQFLIARQFAVALGTVVAAQLAAMVISIAGQLLMIKYANPAVDEWDGVLSGYAGLYVYSGYATKRIVNWWLQFTTNYQAQLQEWSIVIAVAVLALVFVFRKSRIEKNRRH